MTTLSSTTSNTLSSSSSQTMASWQEQAIKVSQYYISLTQQHHDYAAQVVRNPFHQDDSSNANSNANTNTRVEEDWFFFPMENTSIDQCRSCLSFDGHLHCPTTTTVVDDKPLWWLVLRWLKIILLKVARSYHAKPMVLVIAPLCIGMAIGYWVGIKCANGNKKDLQPTDKPQDQNPQSYPLIRMATKITSTYVRLLASIVRTFSFMGCQILVLLVAHRTNKTTNEQATKVQQHSDNTNNDKAIDSSLSLDAKDEKTIPSTVLQGSTDSERVDKDQQDREQLVRTNLLSDAGCQRESGIPRSQLPKHVAVVMDGNRRYGKAKYGNTAQGHWDGSSKLVEFAKWCIAEQIQVLTVYAFSTENWNRDPTEVASLMTIFATYCEELRIEALKRNIQVLVQSTDSSRIPTHVQTGLKRLVEDTSHCQGGLLMNICMSYGSRDEIVNATRSLAWDVLQGKVHPSDISACDISQRLLISATSGGDPDVLIRSGAEVRLSNFLLWQVAYSELFFVSKPWPMMEKEDLLNVIRTFANRKRRFGR